ncbi:unnamed protein product [Penicillium salamii]|uniref:Uncharacterized protein n=1 Tax=Penicillium salamii TaxID=1612424 RepID=A0A9W4JK04_9EURO|nr:unnamed protein product [Penicillium salamii]CAG8062947.1 unnamed protein product [Penicillium salamii]CAG8139240.1 unnamed protein product [Penicillium salamii]CAG8156802.1 unnamed protein product [Penicillium salamii]CAG8169553.1 unnamed protein product [Penicillium salamii]
MSLSLLVSDLKTYLTFLSQRSHFLNTKMTHRIKAFGYSSEYGFLLYKGRTIEKKMVANLLITEKTSREDAQRAEVLRLRIPALKKAWAIEPEAIQGKQTKCQLEQAENELEEIEARSGDTRYKIYQAEYMLQAVLKEDYDALRNDPKWYMREGLVQDCVDQGGCCSRQCGCCAKRDLSQNKKGSGHCTFECGCCIAFEGRELTKEQKKERRKDFRDDLERCNSQLILRMADLFIHPLKHQWFSRSGQINQKI